MPTLPDWVCKVLSSGWCSLMLLQYWNSFVHCLTLLEWSHNPVQACEKNMLLNHIYHSAAQHMQYQT
jgi:hypothetical protein